MAKATPKGTIDVRLTLRGEPAAVVHALAKGLPLDALAQIRAGMEAEILKRMKRPRKGTRKFTIRGTK